MRRIHRVATLVVGVQLVVWAATGVAFSWFDFGRLRGAADRAPGPALAPGAARVGPDEAIARAGAARVTGLELAPRAGRAAWIVRRDGDAPLVVDAQTGEALPPLDGDEAAAVARAAFRGEVGVAARAEVTVGDGSDAAPPAWRVRLDDARRTDVIVDARTGAVVGWRNAEWRLFDGLWSLHVLGWWSRENPSHVPMRLVSAAALVVVLSGVALLARTLKRRRAVRA